MRISTSILFYFNYLVSVTAGAHIWQQYKIICASRVLNPRKWSLSKQSSLKFMLIRSAWKCINIFRVIIDWNGFVGRLQHPFWLQLFNTIEA